MTSDAVRPVMDVDQLAEYFGVARSTVYRWRDEEGLPWTKVGGIVRFRLSAVDAWHAEYETRKTAPPPAEPAVRRRRRVH